MDAHMVWKSWEQLIMEHELRLAERKGRARIPCPCKFCHAGKLLPLSAIELHLKHHGRDPWIRRSMMGEDPVGGWPEVGEYVLDNASEGGVNEVPVEGSDQAEWNSEDFNNPVLDQYHDVEQMFRDAMDLSKRIHEEVVHNTSPQVEHPIQWNDLEESNIRRLEQLYAQASIPLYMGSSITMITIMVILNMCTTHGTSNTFQEELLK
jgi:hypothetical protein